MREAISTFRTLDLPGGSLVPFTPMPGERVRILYGRVWLTEEGIARDAFLASGEEVSLGSRGLAVIEALGPARIQLIEDVRPSLLARTTVVIVARVMALVRRWAFRSPRAARGAV
ncbi:MAG TPA: DUF2917 domain-containing protein [Burkholderiaceae bacterium]|nr:DUF2917 domain-containing protein [Burkholderiaceae bacterium]